MAQTFSLEEKEEDILGDIDIKNYQPGIVISTLHTRFHLFKCLSRKN